MASREWVKVGGKRSPAFGSGFSDGEELKNGAWTVFVDNLSKRVSRFALKELFNHHGKVVRVFIPMVNNKAKYKEVTFAFVTMASKPEMERVILRLDKTKVDGFEVRVSQARYPRSMGDLSYNKEKKVRFEPAFTSQKEPGTASVSMNPQTDINNGKTYKEALLSKDRAENVRKDTSLLDFKIPAKEYVWMNYCLAGIIKEQFEIDFVQRALLNDGIDVKVVK
ncbi:hypothetical protein HRI_001180600 [Hibiscus trionum]|uniref:RRM domain-containing protein n=1 Tax=Hibiscus trionum TaxID=183268 RepID=A0A9W7HDX6_HIBTR|nr:hypothetical protein HRI_001180600 [Hibiscus trionum]